MTFNYVTFNYIFTSQLYINLPIGGKFSSSVGRKSSAEVRYMRAKDNYVYKIKCKHFIVFYTIIFLLIKWINYHSIIYNLSKKFSKLTVNIWRSQWFFI